MATTTGETTVSVNWSQGGNTAPDIYYQYRSPDGSTGWTVLDSTTGTSYTDTGLTGNTTYWYRAAASLAGAASGYSNTDSATTWQHVGIVEMDLGQELILSPNPNTGQFMVTMPQAFQKLKIELLNMQGQTLLTEQFEDQASLVRNYSLINLAKGMFWLKVNTEVGTAVKRFVVQ